MRAEAVPQLVKIIDLTHDARGVADVNGERVFVPGALPEEMVEITVQKRKRGQHEARLVRIVEPASNRVEPPCDYFGTCGGCVLQHLSDAGQVAFKQNVVVQAFQRIARTEPEVWLPPITGRSWGYRRRARLGVKYVAAKERVLVGFRERSAPYITDMAHCPVLVPPLGALLGELAEVIAQTSIRQRLPQIEVAIGDDASALVFRVLDPPSRDDEALLDAFGRRHGIDIYLQRGGPGTVAALTTDPRPLSYRLPQFDVTLRFAPTDFIQINAQVNEQMVAAAIELADVQPTDRVLDLYCGLGNFSLPFAQRAGELLGVEGEAGLVARAVRNATLNNIENARFLSADLAQTDWPFFKDHWDIVVLDPPRTGAEVAIAQMKNLTPRRIVYISCHPATLARDAKVLVEDFGYRLRSARVLDMFPHTHHVEAITLFERD